MGNTITYYDVVSIMAINSFIVQAPGVKHRDRSYRNDISLKSSNVKLNINDVCNLIER